MATLAGDNLIPATQVFYSKFRPRPPGGIDLSAFETVTGGGSDAVRPLVSNVTPSLGSPITGATPLQFDVTDNQNAIAQVIIAIEFANSAIVEVAYDGNYFTAAYATSSVVAAILNGFRFTLQRAGGWPGSVVTLRVFATDASGNVLTGV